MRDTYKFGNAQSIGSFQIQSNYFMSGYAMPGMRDGAIAVLADGTVDHINGRRCAVLAAEACMHAFHAMPPQVELTAFFDFIAFKILREMREIIFLGKTPNLSISFQFFRGQELFYYSVGSNILFLFDGTEYRILEGTNGCMAISKGMTAGMMSCGAAQAIKETEIISCLKKKSHPYEKAQEIIRNIKSKKMKEAGNATVVLVEDCL